MNTLTWAFILFFGWLVVRSIQQQSMNAQPTRTLIDEDLKKVGYIAGRGFHLARGIADMTAALLLVVWKVLTSDSTQKYAAGAISSTTALAGKLGDAARRMNAGKFVPLGNHRALPSADVAPEDTSLNQQQGAANDAAVLDCPSGNLRIIPVEQAEAAYRDARHDVKGLVGEQTENLISHMLIPSIPEFYEAGPDEASAESPLTVDVDPDTEALAIVEGLRAGLSKHRAYVIMTDEAARARQAQSMEKLQELFPENTEESSENINPPVLTGSEAPSSADSKPGSIEFAEDEGEEHEQPAQPANQGFGTARNRAQQSAKKNNQPRKGGASQTGGPSVPDFVRRLPRNK